jgi:uncharacterized protein YjiS (DUF1127 family)
MPVQTVAAHLGRHPSRFLAALRLVPAALAARRQRRHLAALPADRLHDIGLTPEEASAEARRGMWDVPAHWLR